MSASYPTCPHCGRDIQSSSSSQSVPPVCCNCRQVISSEHPLLEEENTAPSFSASHLYPPGYLPAEKSVAAPAIETNMKPVTEENISEKFSSDPLLPPRSTSTESFLPERLSTGPEENPPLAPRTSSKTRARNKPARRWLKSAIWAMIGVIVLLITAVVLLNFV